MGNVTEVKIACGYMNPISSDGIRVKFKSLSGKVKEKAKVVKEKERGKVRVSGEEDPHPQEDIRMHQVSQVLSYHQGHEVNPRQERRMPKFVNGI